MSRVPLYCLLEFNIGEGVLGGHVISGYSQGLNMALIGKRILGGESPADIAVASQEYNSLIFNHKELVRFAISEETLPEGSIIINRPYSLYEDYFREIWISITAFPAPCADGYSPCSERYKEKAGGEFPQGVGGGQLGRSRHPRKYPSGELQQGFRLHVRAEG